MPNVLAGWIGLTDLRAMTEPDHVGVGPIARALEQRSFDQVCLLSNFSGDEASRYVGWLKGRSPADVKLFQRPLSGPTNFAEIYESAKSVISEVLEKSPTKPLLTFHLSPGTPAMAAVWIILAKTRFPAELIESSQKHGVQTVSFPFDIAADFIPDLLRGADAELARLGLAEPSSASEFADVIHRSTVMKRVVARARRVAPRSVPVLLEGETGTGKELMARAIHRASPRKDKPFISVNCGAIPSELVEAELFGYEKGAFTGAAVARPGYFESANAGTLFLDEIGELPLPAQVKLLRVLQEGEVRRLGGRQSIAVDVRIISATNRNLLNEVAAGRFRADLFYRLGVAVVQLPSLREREGDMSLLIDHFLEKINSDSAAEPGYQRKSLAVAAKKLLLAHAWPGNVRELLNTLLRAAVWSQGTTIQAEDVREAMLPALGVDREGILDRPLGNGFDLNAILSTVARHYLERAAAESHGNKTKSAELLGLPSYQTLTNWLKRYGVQFGTDRA
jgi:DNA-binding NtrC family response regulator